MIFNYSGWLNLFGVGVTLTVFIPTSWKGKDSLRMPTYPRKFLRGKFLRAINFRTPITILHSRASEAICVTSGQKTRRKGTCRITDPDLRCSSHFWTLLESRFPYTWNQIDMSGDPNPTQFSPKLTMPSACPHQIMKISRLMWLCKFH